MHPIAGLDNPGVRSDGALQARESGAPSCPDVKTPAVGSHQFRPPIAIEIGCDDRENRMAMPHQGGLAFTGEPDSQSGGALAVDGGMIVPPVAVKVGDDAMQFRGRYPGAEEQRAAEKQKRAAHSHLTANFMRKMIETTLLVRKKHNC